MRLRPSHILAAFIAAAALIAPSAAQAGCAAASARPAKVSNATAVRATLCLLNVQRRKHHLRPLRENTKLDRAAAGHSRSMVRNKYFDHGDFAGRIRHAGYHGYTLGENIAWGSGGYSTPKSIVNMWMHSPGHRANILHASFRDIGIGIANGAPEPGVHGAATYTTDFGSPG
ncbi:MAG TPA: CAP domain-containing protein [Thermoleophilaceae bacterium]|jgi:uncharacterized protein YkwD